MAKKMCKWYSSTGINTCDCAGSRPRRGYVYFKKYPCPKNTNSSCEIIPKRKSKVRRVPGTLAMEYDGYLSVYTNQKMPLNAIGAPCFVEINEKYLKEKP